MILKQKSFLLIISLVLLIVLFTVGCAPDPVEEPEIPEEVEEEEPIVEEPEEEVPAPEEPVEIATYFWPWLSHGQLVLSSSEVIFGPSMYESDLGFIAGFTEDYAYSGALVWLVEESDVFALEWVTLSFDVEFFDQHEWVFELSFDFEIDDLQPEPADTGVQEFELNLADEQEGFRVKINKIILGKEQEGVVAAGPINYVALEVEMEVVALPQ